MTQNLHFGLMQALVPARIGLMRKHRERRGWTDAGIRAYQDAKVRDLVAYCWRHVPYYRSKWQGHIGASEDIRGVANLARLPVLSKDKLRENLPALATTSPEVKSTRSAVGVAPAYPRCSA